MEEHVNDAKQRPKPSGVDEFSFKIFVKGLAAPVLNVPSKSAE
jgi:hypothetical protein